MTTCVIIHSCDKYHYILDEFFEHLETHFPISAFTIFHITETLQYEKPYTHNIVANDTSWSNRFVIALNQIPFDNFLYLQEDMILTNVDKDILPLVVNLHEINQEHKCMITKCGTFHDFKLQPTNMILNNTYPIFIQADGDYIMSHQPPAIFNKTFFLRTLYREHNVWTHECEVTTEIKKGQYGELFALCIGNIFRPINKSEIITSHHAIRKGIYVPHNQI
jgi:hypothetical protein